MDEWACGRNALTTFVHNATLAAVLTGAQLKRRLTAAGWTYERLADRIGVHRTTVMRWVQGARKIRGPSELAIRALLHGNGARSRTKGR